MVAAEAATRKEVDKALVGFFTVFASLDLGFDIEKFAADRRPIDAFLSKWVDQKWPREV